MASAAHAMRSMAQATMLSPHPVRSQRSRVRDDTVLTPRTVRSQRARNDVVNDRCLRGRYAFPSMAPSPAAKVPCDQSQAYPCGRHRQLGLRLGGNNPSPLRELCQAQLIYTTRDEVTSSQLNEFLKMREAPRVAYRTSSFPHGTVLHALYGAAAQAAVVEHENVAPATKANVARCSAPTAPHSSANPAPGTLPQRLPQPSPEPST
eukprot:scaffold89387_cov62-Phaeocystis_antarctica.AAC.4